MYGMFAYKFMIGIPFKRMRPTNRFRKGLHSLVKDPIQRSQWDCVIWSCGTRIPGFNDTAKSASETRDSCTKTFRSSGLIETADSELCYFEVTVIKKSYTKRILKLKINLIRKTLNFISIQWSFLQVSPISWAYPLLTASYMWCG
jgi:hypothetical protein